MLRTQLDFPFRFSGFWFFFFKVFGVGENYCWPSSKSLGRSRDPLALRKSSIKYFTFVLELDLRSRSELYSVLRIVGIRGSAVGASIFVVSKLISVVFASWLRFCSEFKLFSEEVDIWVYKLSSLCSSVFIFELLIYSYYLIVSRLFLWGIWISSFYFSSTRSYVPGLSKSFSYFLFQDIISLSLSYIFFLLICMWSVISSLSSITSLFMFLLIVCCFANSCVTFSI